MSFVCAVLVNGKIKFVSFKKPQPQVRNELEMPKIPRYELERPMMVRFEAESPKTVKKSTQI